MRNRHSEAGARPISVPARRFERLGKLGSLSAGIASSMALNSVKQLGQGKRPSLRNLLLTQSNVQRVSDQLAQMRGAAMKIGQLMSMDAGDVLPPELSQILMRLRDNANPMPPAQLKRVLNAEWPVQWLRSFDKFDVRPIAAASIGQVHRGQLKDGRDLAIKVQYPGVAKSIDSDVANFGILMRMSGLLPKGFKLAPYLEEGRKQLHAETNYHKNFIFNHEEKTYGGVYMFESKAAVKAYMAGDVFKSVVENPEWSDHLVRHYEVHSEASDIQNKIKQSKA